MLGSLWKRVASFRRPGGPAVGDPPAVGDAAPEQPGLAAGEPRVVLFLRQVGSVFTERLLAEFRASAREFPDVAFVAVVHGDPEAALDWGEELGLERVEGAARCRDPGAGNLRLLVDEDRALYADWGLGLGGPTHLFRPAVLRNLRRARRTTTSDRPPSGTRWQRAGMFGVDPDGTVRTRHVAAHAGDLPDVRVAPTFLDVPATTTEPAATARTTEREAPAPRDPGAETTPAITRAALEPRPVTEATPAVRPVTAESPAEAAERSTERRRLRTDGG